MSSPTPVSRLEMRDITKRFGATVALDGVSLRVAAGEVLAAVDEDLTHYKQQIPAMFWFNALLIASNGTDSRVGSLTADWERWVEWKRIEREDEPRRTCHLFRACHFT